MATLPRSIALLAALAGIGMTASNGSSAADIGALTLPLASPIQQLALNPQIAHADADTLDGGVPCAGYYIIYVNGIPVKVWYPTGCTPQ